jgi:Type II secretion system (T2SS), protein E, N-terminal domain
MLVLKRMLAKRENPHALEKPDGAESASQAHYAPTWLESCANPECRSGWLHPWRRRSVPVFEQGWTCSPECTRSLVHAAVSRVLSGKGTSGETHRHRIPLGLVMLEQGWISRAELQRALAAQRSMGTGRLGQWLMRHHAVSEETIARALGLQWSCPVLHADPEESESLGAAIPRLFVDAFGVIPLRLAAGKVLYLGFEASLDPAMALAVEQMTGLQVESGIVPESQFHRTHSQILGGRFPAVELVEAVSPTAAANALSKCIECALPVASRLVRVHDSLWLRLFLRRPPGPLPEIGGVEDVICSIGRIQ